MGVLQEGFFGHRYYSNDQQNHFFSYGPHVDTSNQVGLSGGMRSDTVGLHVWMPLMDIDPEKDGGSVHIWPGFPDSLCPFAKNYVPTHNQIVSHSAMERDCQRVMARSKILSLRKGDIGLWHQNMLHTTQPVLNPSH